MHLLKSFLILLILYKSFQFYCYYFHKHNQNLAMHLAYLEKLSGFATNQNKWFNTIWAAHKTTGADCDKTHTEIYGFFVQDTPLTPMLCACSWISCMFILSISSSHRHLCKGVSRLSVEHQTENTTWLHKDRRAERVKNSLHYFILSWQNDF